MSGYHILVEDGRQIAFAANATYRNMDAAVLSTIESVLLIAGERFAEGHDQQTLVCEVLHERTGTYRRLTVSVDIDRNG